MKHFFSIIAFLALAGLLNAQGPSLTGRWPQGNWQSDTTGHTGPLKGTFKQVDATHYKVTFTGRFAKVIPFRYSQTLQITSSSDDTVFLSGSSRLPGFGTFHYNATATQYDFTANYRSKKDNGTFRLTR